MSSPSPHRYAVLAVVLAAVLMSVLDGIVVGIALPSITASVRNLGMTVGTAVGTLVISAQLAGAGSAGSILQADKPLLALVLGITILVSGAVAGAASLTL